MICPTPLLVFVSLSNFSENPVLMIETPEELNLQTNLNSDWSFDCEYLYQKQFSIIVLSHLISEFRQRHDNFTLLEFKKTDKQMTAKPIVDYFQRI